MSERLIYFFGNGKSDLDTDSSRLVAAEAKALLGGKGSSLHAMTAFGLPVPPGFTIVTAACRHYYDNDRRRPPGLDEEIRVNLRRLEEAAGRRYGDPADPLLVSVRSGAAESMPGMMDTVLNCGDPAKGDPAGQLDRAVDDVFASWMNERAVAYRKEKNIAGLAGTAVTVQAMCPAQVAGVLFTINANTGDAGEMVIEAVPGLGESLVLGEVVPDNYIVTRPAFAAKLRRPAGDKPLLSDEQLGELGRLGLRVEEYYGHPLDIEWAWLNGEFLLLQARQVKSTAGEREALRRAEIERLRKTVGAEGNVWSRYNISETLPAPLPMTWSLMRRFYSTAGGFAQFQRSVGYRPGLPADKSTLELICGRVFNNLAHEQQMWFDRYPYRHDFAAMRADPRKALYPVPAPGPMGLLKRIGHFWRTMMVEFRVGGLRKRLADRLEKEVFPRLAEETRKARAEDLSKLSDKEMVALVRSRAQKYWNELGAELFAGGFLADRTLNSLRLALTKGMGEAAGEKLAQRAITEGIRSTTGDSNRMLAEVAAGKARIEDYLDAHGHRAIGELELATPRDREDRAGVERMIEQLRDNPLHAPHAETPAPAADGTDAIQKEIQEKCGFVWGTQGLKDLEWVRRYFPLRETAKHYVMMGYELIRLALLELDRRWGLHGGVFYLEEGELDAANTWPDLKDVIAKRKQQRELMLKIALPDVVFSDALEQVGNPPPPPDAKEFTGLGVSPGVVEGPAKVVFDPHKDRPAGKGYILVCPSTDPGWTPLFVNAAGLVLERGGMLSHGSLVAREFHLPAVAGIDQITRVVTDGRRIRVDGNNGKIYLLEDGQT